MLPACKDFEGRFSIVEEKHPAIGMAKKATGCLVGRFRKQDVMDLCPSLSISSVELALRNLVATGELEREGVGKSTCYFRLG